MTKLKIILLTAFEPFGGESVNPSELILQKLPNEVNGYDIKKVLLPVDFVKAPTEAIKEYDKAKPQAVIMVGQAGGRASISVETVGKNLMTARIPDASGFMPQNEKIILEGKDSIVSTLPNDKIIKALNKKEIEVYLSNDAGGYVCNTLLYSMLHHNNGDIPTGFIHVPFIKEQGHNPFMELEDMYQAILTIINVVIEELNMI